MDDFLILLYEVRNERIQRQRREYEELNRLGEHIYTDFRIWCNAFRDAQGKTDAKVFSEYLKEQNVSLSFWQKKHLAEKYFGYKYEWNDEEQKWKIRKVK